MSGKEMRLVDTYRELSRQYDAAIREWEGVSARVAGNVHGARTSARYLSHARAIARRLSAVGRQLSKAGIVLYA